MYSFHSIGDILDFSIQFHRSALSLLVSIDKATPYPSSRILLGYMEEHRIQLIETLSNMRQQKKLKLLDNYIMFDYPYEEEAFFDQFDRHAAYSHEELLQLHQDLEEELIQFYLECEVYCHSPQLGEFLNIIRTINRQELNIFNMATHSLDCY